MPLNIAPVAHVANERHKIYLRKTFLEGKIPPKQYAPVFPLVEPGKTWRMKPHYLTDDEILHDYRFTNVFRELDTETVWIRENIREQFADHEHLWFMLAIARQINWHRTLDMLIKTPGAWPSHPDFDPKNMTAAREGWKAAGNKVETCAYQIHASRDPNKSRYISEVVLGNLWRDRDAFKKLFDFKPDMRMVWERLQNNRYEAWGPFMAGQVTTDLRHTRYLDQASDRASWAALGPGSRRGLNRLYGRPRDDGLSQGQALKEMREIQAQLPKHLDPCVPKDIELTDIQSLCCELDKYLREKYGEGHPKQRYVPAGQVQTKKVRPVNKAAQLSLF